MEDTLRVACRDLYANSYNSLNPCFNGRYSQRAKLSLFPCLVLCLNPCFNGRYSQSQLLRWDRTGRSVLILVLMEDTLRATLCVGIAMIVTS